MIVVAGCGYVGAALADRLHQAGQSVLGLTHSSLSAEALAKEKPWKVAACNIADRVGLAALEAGLEEPVEAFVHCASSGGGGVCCTGGTGTGGGGVVDAGCGLVRAHTSTAARPPPGRFA